MHPLHEAQLALTRRQLFGRAARQGDPGCAQLFACAEDDLFLRHANHLRKGWRALGATRLIRMAPELAAA